MKGPAVLWLIRHLDIDDKPGQMIGWTDLPLADPSSAAKCAADYAGLIGGADRVFSSDLTRAVQTAQPLADALECPLELTGDLREIHFGRWEQRTWPEVERTDPQGYARVMENWQQEPMPGGESSADLLRRVERFCGRLLLSHDGRTVVVVGHGGSLRPLAGLILNLSIKQAMAHELERGKSVRIDRHAGRAKWNIDPSIKISLDDNKY